MIAAAVAAPAHAQSRGEQMRESGPGEPGPARTIEITPRISASISATDNVRATTRDEKSDVFLTLAPGISVNAVRPGWRGTLDYSLSGLHYLREDDLDGLFHRLSHGATAELVEDHVYLDTRAAIRQEFLDPVDGLSAREQVASENAETIATYMFSPYLLNRFGGWAESELRYRFDHVVPFDGALSQTVSNTASASLTNGAYFTLLRWRLDLLGRTTAHISDNDFADRSSNTARAELDLAYDVNRHVSILGSAGYRHLDDDTYRSDASGMIWSLGASLRPNARSELSARYRHEFERDFFQGQAAWIFGPGTYVAAEHDEVITTSQQQIAERLENVAVAPDGSLVDVSTLPQVVDEFGQPVDVLELLGLELLSDVFGLNDFAFNERRTQIRLDWARGRDTVAGVVFRDQRWSDDVDYERIGYGASLRWERELTPLLTGEAKGRFRRIYFEAPTERVVDIYGAGLGLGYWLTPETRVFGAYDMLLQDPEDGEDLLENLVTIGITRTF